jgi:glycine dehydrogenase
MNTIRIAPHSAPLHSLENHGEFIARHIGPRPADIEAMLATVGAASLEALAAETLPPSILDEGELDLAPARGEHETLLRLRTMADRNVLRHNMIGLGYHETPARCPCARTARPPRPVRPSSHRTW